MGKITQRKQGSSRKTWLEAVATLKERDERKETQEGIRKYSARIKARGCCSRARQRSVWKRKD
jgi:hypothetical protein